MNLTINEYNKNYEINMGNITQILGANYKVKKYIYDSLIKHFSLYKYQSFDEYMENNIKIDNEIPGRKEYKVINIKDREGLIEQIKLNKNAIVCEYLKNVIETLSCQKQINVLDESLTQIYMIINEKLYQDIGEICIDYEMQNLLSIVSKSEVITKNGFEIESMSNYELLEVLLKLVKENNRFNPEKNFILFHSIDHLITNNEYEKLINNVLGYDKKIYMIFSISTDNFVYVNKEILNYITVFNSASFQVPNFDTLEEFIKMHYPVNKDFKEEETLLILRKVLNKVGIENDSISIKELLVKKFINKAICVNDLYEFNVLKEELACLNSQ